MLNVTIAIFLKPIVPVEIIYVKTLHTTLNNRFCFRENKFEAALPESLLEHLVTHLRILAQNDDKNATSGGLALTFTSNQSKNVANENFVETLASQILKK